MITISVLGWRATAFNKAEVMSFIEEENQRVEKINTLYDQQKTRCVEAVYFHLSNLRELDELRSTENYGDLCGACHVKAEFFFEKYNKKWKHYV